MGSEMCIRDSISIVHVLLYKSHEIKYLLSIINHNYLYILNYHNDISNNSSKDISIYDIYDTIITAIHQLDHEHIHSSTKNESSVSPSPTSS